MILLFSKLHLFPGYFIYFKQLLLFFNYLKNFFEKKACSSLHYHLIFLKKNIYLLKKIYYNNNIFNNYLKILCDLKWIKK